MKEREAEIAVDPEVAATETMHEEVSEQSAEEALYLVDDTMYLHVQPTDGGWDYSFYDKESKRLLDGGVIETAAIEESPVSSIEGAVRTEVFALHGMTPTKVTFEDVALMRKHVGTHVKVKAAGGISSVADGEKFIELGADRLGTSRLIALLSGADDVKGY